jgi:S-adenosylmethionine:tRNA ribosyltransferase-isomerase
MGKNRVFMKLSQFKFPFRADLIAKEPTRFRDDCKLMVMRRQSGKIENKIFKNILDYAREGDIFVLNDTKVFPARLQGNKEKTGAEIEVSLLRELNREQRLWDVLVDPARKIRIGNKLYFGENDSLVAEVIDNTTSRGRTLRFLFDGSYEDFRQTLFSVGELPVPKEIRPHPNEEDLENFNTIFARNEGAIATPAAGLHFSRELFTRMEIKGVESTFITSHVGLSNFGGVDVEDLSKHKMGSERIIISEESAEKINKAKADGHKVFAIGVTVARALETPVTTTHRVKPIDGWTNKFIFPPYDFKIVDALVTNFHYPLSTMLMCQAAFGGYDKVMAAYKQAMHAKDASSIYRFGIYGDAMLIV